VDVEEERMGAWGRKSIEDRRVDLRSGGGSQSNALLLE
jgi:hypothetical protein